MTEKMLTTCIMDENRLQQQHLAVFCNRFGNQRIERKVAGIIQGSQILQLVSILQHVVMYQLSYMLS